MMSVIFRDLFARFNNELHTIANKNIRRGIDSQFDIARHLPRNIITCGLAYAIETGDSNLPSAGRALVGMSQGLDRLTSCRFASTRLV